MARSNTVVMTTKATMNGLKNLDCGITDLGLRTGIREKKGTQFTWKCTFSLSMAVFLNLFACP